MASASHSPPTPIPCTPLQTPFPPFTVLFRTSLFPSSSFESSNRIVLFILQGSSLHLRRLVPSFFLEPRVSVNVVFQGKESQYSRCGRTDKGVSSVGQVITLFLRSNLKIFGANDGGSEKHSLF
ncbi:hypothetical protein PIB30_046528 [Stylosanthes scabra]|uniref:Uncharacterized protein n=1 Tax=Stylosanthes scabra TaxID=79078 RepID=A0ABU6RGH6_9FABA|nr:hypothetical protein [Stylosanthes scabra]